MHRIEPTSRKRRRSPRRWRSTCGLYYALLMFPTFLCLASAVDELVVDPYGGIQALRGKATGAFHMEKVEKRDCLITPDGHGFLSLGVVHIGAIREPSKIDLFHDQYGGDWKRASEAAARNLQSWGFNRTKDQL